MRQRGAYGPSHAGDRRQAHRTLRGPARRLLPDELGAARAGPGRRRGGHRSESRDAARLRVPSRSLARGRGAARGRGRQPGDPHARGMSIALYRIDDRLIHGQVVVGWGKPLNVGFIVLVDDAVRASTWEQELYRMGVPPDIEVVFASTEEASERLPQWESDGRVGILV